MELAGERLAATKRVGEIRPILHAVGQLASYYAMGGDWEAFEETLDAVPYDDLVRADQITIDDQRRWRRQVQGEPEWAEQRWRELTTEFRDLVGEMERQIEDWWKVDEAFLALHNGRPVEAFDLVIDLDDDSPNLTDVEVSLVVAMYLEDGERLQQVADVFATKVYRGRRVDWLRLALEGALAAAGGERDAAAGRFREASDLMEGHELELRAAEFRACMAGMLGLDHPLGRELGQRAFAAFSAAGATTLLGLYADSLVDEAEEGAVSASA
jgi:hypothetical protein